MNQMNLHFNNKSGLGVGDEPNRILLVTIHNILYPITKEVLHQVFSPHGIVENIIIIPKLAGFQALIQFQSHQIAVTTRNTLHERNIYDGCCQLDIQLGYGDTRGKTTARVLESDPKLEPKVDDIGSDLEQKQAEIGAGLVPKVKQEICETAKVQERSAVTDLEMNMVINMYSKYGLVGYARKVFDGMPEMVVAGSLVVLRCVCEIIFHREEDAKQLKTALIEARQLINGLEGMIVMRYFVLLVFDPGGTRMKRPFCLKFKEEQFKVNIDQIESIANAVTGAYANFVIEEKLEASMDSILKGIPLENSNLDHRDSYLTYAKQFVIIMLKVNEPNVTATSDGGRKRNMLLGRGIFVTYSNSITNVAANAQDGIAYFHAGPDDIVQSVTRSGILCFIAINDLNQYIAKRRSSAMQLLSNVRKASYEDNAPSKCRRAYENGLQLSEIIIGYAKAINKAIEILDELIEIYSEKVELCLKDTYVQILEDKDLKGKAMSGLGL